MEIIGDGNMLQTQFGVISGIQKLSCYESGSVSDIMLNEKNVIITHVGELVPYYKEETPRRKYKNSLSFYESGLVKSIYLEEQQDIQTPIGEFPAEFVTFYETGELKRFFVLEGKINGFWTEDDERNLNIPFQFEFPFSAFTAMLVGICFYRSGDIRSVTLFPKEVITVTAKNCGKIKVKNGFSMYESGELESVEPALPTLVRTPFGFVSAYDVSATGINADTNSLRFDKEGRIIEVITSGDKIMVTREAEVLKIFTSVEKTLTGISTVEDEEGTETIQIPLKLKFDYERNSVKILGEQSGEFPIESSSFQILHGDDAGIGGCTPDKCKSCRVCNG